MFLLAFPGTGGTGEKNMGAAFNLNLLIHDPGAYTHNRNYAKRLIWDSIDWADDETMNNSVMATVDALVTAGKLTSAQRDLSLPITPRGRGLRRQGLKEWVVSARKKKRPPSAMAGVSLFFQAIQLVELPSSSTRGAPELNIK